MKQRIKISENFLIKEVDAEIAMATATISVLAEELYAAHE